MACPECESVRREYLIFRNGVQRFARTLGQLEAERLRVLNQQQLDGLPPVGALAEVIARDAGYLPLEEEAGTALAPPRPDSARTGKGPSPNPTRQPAGHPTWRLIGMASCLVILLSMIL